MKEKRPILAIVLEGGMVQAVVSDDPELLGRLVNNVVVIDYDTQDAEPSDITLVRQDPTNAAPQGGWAKAIVHEEPIIKAGIGLEDFLPALGALEEK